MLLYNYQKEFLGIDEKDLNILGFSTLAELKAEVNDFADLFVKTPGYVHNFKHVHWIDFIAYANEGEESKVLININAKTFTAKLAVQKAFLVDNPNTPAFIIQLNGLRSLSSDETQHIETTLLQRERPEPIEKEPSTIIPQAKSVHLQESPTPMSVEVPSFEKQQKEHFTTPLETADTQEFITPVTDSLSNDEEPTLDVGDISIDIDESLFEDDTDLGMDDAPLELTPEKKAPRQITTKELDNAPSSAAQKLADSGFVYDPSIASRELGLPLDLIEEFIEDFITQADEFKAKIYTSLQEGDIDNVKILAHKLKGVAANLRVEDAHEVLASISATSDAALIRENIDAFYIIMQRLASKDTPEAPVNHAVSNENEESDVITLPELDEDDIYKTEELLPPQEEEQEEKLSIDFDDLLEEEIEEENIQESQSKPSINYSKEAAAKEIGLSLADFNELFSDFENESQVILKQMREAALLEDMTTLQNEALKLKGMSDNMRLSEFTQALGEIMQMQKKDEILQTINLLESQLKEISSMGA